EPRPAEQSHGARHRLPWLPSRADGRRDELGVRAPPRRRDLERGCLRCARLRGYDARAARQRDQGDQGAHRAAVRRQPDHHAPAALRADRRLRPPWRRVHRARRRPAARRRDRANQGGGCEARLLRSRAQPRQAADPLQGRRPGDRGHGGGRPHRPGVYLRARPGDPAGGRGRHPRVRRRRHRPRRGDRRISGDGRGGRPARHPLRLRDRVRRPPEFQARLPTRLRPRRGGERPARRAAPRDPRPRAQEQGHRAVHRQAARGRRAPRRPAAGDGRSSVADRALLGRRAPPRGDRRRRRARLGDGRAERRHGDQGGTGRGDRRRADGPSRGGAGAARGL
ncbi:MAG: Enoyl-[acyl-carrier-protein] reductase [FMN], partial [uncultured Sphingomonadaceae bacterium]